MRDTILTELIAARSLEDVGAVVCSEVIPAVGAHGGHLVVSEDDQVARFVGITGYPDDVVRTWAPIDLSLETPVRVALRDGLPVWLSTIAERDRAFPALAGVSVGSGSLCAVPVRLGGAPLGSLGLSFPNERAFEPQERDELEAISHVVALALDRILASSGPRPRPEGRTALTFEREWRSPDHVDGYDARRWLRQVLAERSQNPVVDIVVCMSELLTNAVVHGSPPYRLVLTVDGDDATLEMHDCSRSQPRLRTPDIDGGRGLHIVDQLSARWGTTSTGWGKAAWAAFNLSPDG